mmetsp:Transcript_54088/g.129515  ORF Transcript_54088/g.129515 Transcript_54088/m.129515 type:complete len:236 (-) Transcript_54088:157-864(-)
MTDAAEMHALSALSVTSAHLRVSNIRRYALLARCATSLVSRSLQGCVRLATFVGRAQRPKTGMLRLCSSRSHAKRQPTASGASQTTSPTRTTMHHHSHVPTGTTARRRQPHHLGLVAALQASFAPRAPPTRSRRLRVTSARARATLWRHRAFRERGQSTTHTMAPTLATCAPQATRASARARLRHGRACLARIASSTRPYRASYAPKGAGTPSIPTRSNRSVFLAPRGASAPSRA